ncbi:3-demethylubiquinone-9 3-methyltransferase [alpha proteobacterium U9-1i]|nr:3-demethylubiquinone-9 3-methyltransferase [alpha proteobacterium U9-1i]
MGKITPFLWFDGQLEQAVKFYTSVFKDSHVVSINPMTASFVLEGQEFMGLNAGPMFKFNEAVSFFVKCETQEDVDYYWSALTADGGSEGQCAWLKDKFGLSWQIVPTTLGRYLGDADRAKANRVMQAMMKMKKIVIADLDAAAAG